MREEHELYGWCPAAEDGSQSQQKTPAEYHRPAGVPAAQPCA